MITMKLAAAGRSLAAEFKNFALKGSVIDMAVGVIIGSAFSKIVSSLVGDVLMPLLGLILGTIDIQDLSVTLKAATPGPDTVVLRYGAFLQTVCDFVLIALSIFLALKIIFKLKEKLALKEAQEEEAKPDPAAEQTALLREIRDA